jgi:hypothetical protein
MGHWDSRVPCLVAAEPPGSRIGADGCPWWSLPPPSPRSGRDELLLEIIEVGDLERPPLIGIREYAARAVATHDQAGTRPSEGGGSWPASVSPG